MYFMCVWIIFIWSLVGSEQGGKFGWRDEGVKRRNQGAGSYRSCSYYANSITCWSAWSSFYLSSACSYTSSSSFTCASIFFHINTFCPSSNKYLVCLVFHVVGASNYEDRSHCRTQRRFLGNSRAFGDCGTFTRTSSFWLRNFLNILMEFWWRM